MGESSTDQELWSKFFASEVAHVLARQQLFKGARDLAALLSRALARPAERGAALRLQLDLDESRYIRPLLAQLMELASVGHSDIGLVRDVLMRVDREWLIARAEALAEPLLARGGYEEYLRIAELYRLLDSRLLDRHLAACAAHSDPEVREVVDIIRPAHPEP